MEKSGHDLIQGNVTNVKDCLFCQKPQTEILAENEFALAFFDKFPVNQGHTLIIPKRHIANFFEVTSADLQAINELIFTVKNILDERFRPDGYNIGINVGAAAGQTIFHLHCHIIPRYLGDVEDPRGGIRKIKTSVVPYLAEGEKVS